MGTMRAHNALRALSTSFLPLDVYTYVGAIKGKHVLGERERRIPFSLFTTPVADYRSRIITLFLSCTDYSDISDGRSSVSPRI